jgi:iron complex transport system substrate-binding protein
MMKSRNNNSLLLVRGPSTWLFLLSALLSLVPKLGYAQQQEEQPTSNPTECLASPLDPSLDFFPHKVEAEISEWWTIEYRNTYKIVNNLESQTTYVLYPCGADPPALDSNSSLNVTAYIPIPLKSVGVMETPTITYLEQINTLDSVEYFLTEVGYISSPCFLARVEAGFVTVPIPPEAGVVDPVTGEVLEPPGAPETPLNGTVAFGGSWDTPAFFQTIVPVSEWMEQTNQGIFEWVKFYAAFYNREELANQVFAAARQEWDCISLAASSVQTDAEPPQVLWAYYNEYCGGWDVGSCPNYYCEYATACSSRLVDSTLVNGTVYSAVCGAYYLSTEELVQLGQDADYFFFPAPYWNTTYATFGEQLDRLKSVQNRRVYDYQGSGEDAWFQERFAEYYDVLEDYCRVVGKSASGGGPHSSGTGGRWFRNVFTEPVGDAGECDPSATPTLPFVFGGCEAGAGTEGGGNKTGGGVGGGDSGNESNATGGTAATSSATKTMLAVRCLGKASSLAIVGGVVVALLVG